MTGYFVSSTYIRMIARYCKRCSEPWTEPSPNLVPRAFPLKVGGKSPGNEVEPSPCTLWTEAFAERKELIQCCQPQLSRFQNSPDCRLAKIFSLRVYGDRCYNPPIGHVSTEQASALVILDTIWILLQIRFGEGAAPSLPAIIPSAPKNVHSDKKRTPDHRLPIAGGIVASHGLSLCMDTPRLALHKTYCKSGQMTSLSSILSFNYIILFSRSENNAGK